MRTVRMLADPRPSARTHLGTPAAGGMALALAGVAVAATGISRRGPLGVLGTVAGAAMAYRGLTGGGILGRLFDPARVRLGSFPALPDAAPIRAPRDDLVRRAVTVSRPPDAIEAIVRDPAALTAIMDTSGVLPWAGDASAVPGDALRWRLDLPMGQVVDVPLEGGAPGSSSMAWRVRGGVAEGSTLRLGWRERPQGGETEIEAALAFDAGSRAASFGPIRNIVQLGLGGILRRLAALAETGTVPRTEGQASGRVPAGTDSARGAPSAARPPEQIGAMASAGSQGAGSREVRA